MAFGPFFCWRRHIVKLCKSLCHFSLVLKFSIFTYCLSLKRIFILSHVINPLNLFIYCACQEKWKRPSILYPIILRAFDFIWICFFVLSDCIFHMWSLGHQSNYWKNSLQVLNGLTSSYVNVSLRKHNKFQTYWALNLDTDFEHIAQQRDMCLGLYISTCSKIDKWSKSLV